MTVAGTFNGWNKTANPLTQSADGKTWTITLNLAPDVYQYKFVVDGETWTPDPNSLKLQDPQGNTNSLLTVAPPDYKTKPAKVGDGIITESALLHVPDSHYVTRIDKTHIALILRTRRDDLESVNVYTDHGISKSKRLPLDLIPMKAVPFRCPVRLLAGRYQGRDTGEYFRTNLPMASR